MAAILNAIFGSYSESDQANTTTNQTVVEGNTGTTTERLHTSAVADDVQVKSVISSATQAHSTLNTKLNINDLLSQLSTTHSQVDQYSRARTAEINEQAQKLITDVLTNTQRQQEELLLDANRRHLVIDNEYQIQLQRAVEALDAVKAKTLADLERDLQAKQQLIMGEAKRQIDTINDQANAAKLHALVEAQEQAKHEISNLADQVGIIGQQETQHLLQSTTTTTITSKSEAAGNTETVITVPVTETAITTHEHHITTAGDAQMQVAVRSPSELVPSSTFPMATQESTTAFGTATGASDLTTTPASTVATDAHVETEHKSPPDNTTF
jgi:hypothetical protein